MKEGFSTLAAHPGYVLLWATAYFLMIYGAFAGLAWLIARVVRRPICVRPLANGQIRDEILRSLRSVLLFGAGILVPWAMIEAGIASIGFDANLSETVFDCLLMVLWNDLHFYAMHRLLHQKLRRAHAIHHKSVAATPFASYSMSATEALLLGSVMPLAMLAHNFSWQALLFLPVWSIAINTLSHSNTDLFPWAGEGSLLGFIRHHQSHHTHYHGNFGFFFGHLDRWFGTARPFD